MAKRGPQPQPTSRRSKEGRNTFKPELVDRSYMTRAAAEIRKARKRAKAYPVPKSIPRDARTFWRRHAKHCSEVGTLNDETLAQWHELSLAYYRMRKAWRDLDKNGAVCIAPNGCPMRSPWAVEYDKALDIFKKSCDRFKLQPTARPHHSGDSPDDPGAGPAGGDLLD